MTAKRWALGGLSVGVLAVLLWSVNTANVNAQMGGSKEQPGREVTMTGRVVDLHCFMTGEYPSTDHAVCAADCIRSGVPAGLETDTELIVLGQGMTGPAKTLVPLAHQQVEVRGKLFEKNNVKYLDITSIQKATEKKP
jgi:hypothetical protein